MKISGVNGDSHSGLSLSVIHKSNTKASISFAICQNPGYPSLCQIPQWGLQAPKFVSICRVSLWLCRAYGGKCSKQI